VKFDSIIFDWDGTLCQTLGLWVEGYRQGLERLGVPLGEGDIVQDFLHDHAKLESLYPTLCYGDLLDFAQTFVFETVGGSLLYDGATENLERLAAEGIKIALVSTSPRHVVLAGVRAHGLEGYFASILGGDDVENIKPHPEPFETTMREIGARAHRTIIIGDNRGDIEAGKAAGAKTCLFAPVENKTYHDFNALRRSCPDFEIDHLEKLRP